MTASTYSARRLALIGGGRAPGYVRMTRSGNRGSGEDSMPKAEIIPAEDPGAETDSAAREESAAEARRQRISVAAYYRALRRGFAPGGEVEDWYAAEKDDQAAQGTRRDEP